uniref:Uncharacterized protein n=1 Tax=Rhizophora mucronata TaxID=61149 RepID=A0A2P2MZY7_RHIMU
MKTSWFSFNFPHLFKNFSKVLKNQFCCPLLFLILESSPTLRSHFISSSNALLGDTKSKV